VHLSVGPTTPSSDLEQEFLVAQAASEAVISLKYRWGRPEQAAGDPSVTGRIELGIPGESPLFSWAVPAETCNAMAWSETALALPALAPGRYALKLVLQRSAGASPYLDVARADVVVQ